MRAHLMLLMLVSSSAVALPVCYYDDPTGSGEREVHLYKEADSVLPDGGCVVWHCDVGHKWVKEGFCFTAADAAVHGSDKVRSWIGMSKDERNQLWANNVVKPAPGTIDHRMLQWMNTLPMPTVPPPSGLVTRDNKVYALVVPTNGSPVMQLVGVVKPELFPIPCDASQNINGKYRVDRSQVRYPAGAIMPKTTWADCTK